MVKNLVSSFSSTAAARRWRSSRVCRSDARCTLSNALTIKSMDIRCWNYKLCLMMFRRVRIWSLQDWPQQNPACSSQSFLSTASLRHRTRTMQNTFPGTDRSVIPLHFFQSARFPFFGSLMMTPLRWFSGTSAVAQHVFRIHTMYHVYHLCWCHCIQIHVQILVRGGWVEGQKLCRHWLVEHVLEVSSFQQYLAVLIFDGSSLSTFRSCQVTYDTVKGLCIISICCFLHFMASLLYPIPLYFRYA